MVIELTKRVVLDRCGIQRDDAGEAPYPVARKHRRHLGMKEQSIQAVLACDIGDSLTRTQTCAHSPVALIDRDAASKTMCLPGYQAPKGLHIGITRHIALEVLGVCDMAE